MGLINREKDIAKQIIDWGYKLTPHSMKYFVYAFTHKTYENESERKGNYEIMEFLGDSLLQFISARFVIENLRIRTPGEASVMRSKIVSTSNLAKVSLRLGFDNLIQKSTGAVNLENNVKVLADVFESVLAAVYYTQGEHEAIEFCHRSLLNKESVEHLSVNKDPKTVFQEFVQKFSKQIPNYITTFDDNERCWIAKLLYDEQIFGIGRGRSKKGAETNAAIQAIRKYTNQPDDEIVKLFESIKSKNT